MELGEIDWGTVLGRIGILVCLWLGLGIVRYYVGRWLKTAGKQLDRFSLSDSDKRILMIALDIILVVIGTGVTLSVVQVTSFLFIATIAPKVIALVVIWAAVWVLVRYLSIWIQELDERTEEIDIDPRDLKTLDRLLDWVVILIGIIGSLAILEVSSLLYSVLTAAGVLSVIVGLAVKDVAANFVSGVFLLIDRPFVVGDVIKIKDFVGTVNQISLRSTEIITLDGPVVTIPNSAMAVEPTINYTLSAHRRVLFTISVLNTTDLGLAVSTIQEILESEQRILPSESTSIQINQIRDYAVDLQVIAYTRKEEVLQTQSDLQQAIITAFSSRDIELAVPIRVNVSPGPRSTRHSA